MPQLQINQGPQDALLYDNSRSYFTNVGYVRTSNFQVEYREVEPQNQVAFGGTMNFVIPKAADLLGPTDLRIEIPAPTGGFTPASGAGTSADPYVAHGQTGDLAFTQWVEELGFAIIEKVTFAVGSNDIESITGEELQIRNELMTSDEMRLGFDHVMKSGKAASRNAPSASPKPDDLPGMASASSSTAISFTNSGVSAAKTVNKDYTRIIDVCYGTTQSRAGKRKLIIPLGLFFTKHVSQYFPLAAVAGCNDIRISVKLRQLNELMQMGGCLAPNSNVLCGYPTWTGDQIKAKLMCNYVHVTGPEAQTLMNKEHVRLLKLFQHTPKTGTFQGGKMSLDLSFLHPVSTLIVTIRREDDINSDIPIMTKNSVTTKKAFAQRKCQSKGLFFYHGDGTEPNYDRREKYGADTTEVAANPVGNTLKLGSIALTLNGQERHPGLSKGIDVDYLQNRLLPMLHSNSSMNEKQLHAGHPTTGEQAYVMQGSKNIFVYPFSLNPEGSNPSGAVNFSKVSHAKLNLYLDEDLDTGSALHNTTENFRVDVYALYYNWLQIKDGRALLSFA